MKRKKTKLFLIPGIGCLVFCVYIAIQMATSGAELTYLEKTEAELVSRQKEIKNSIYNAGSLKELSYESKEMGFDKPEHIIYTKENAVVANLPKP